MPAKVIYVNNSLRVDEGTAGPKIAGKFKPQSNKHSFHRRRVETALKTNQERLRNLYINLQSEREAERASITREVHDELGQTMTAIRMDMAWMKEKYSDHKEIFEMALSTLALIDATIKSANRICTELRPGILDHLGLGAAIEWQAEEFQKKTGILCEVAVQENLEVDAERSTTLFRIFQEALTNVLHHANATKVTASLKGENGKAILEITDNGKGITEKEISKPDSFGLLEMRERVYQWRGKVTIKSNPNKGTLIGVVLPENKAGVS